MDLTTLLWYVIIGCVAGFLAGLIMKGRGFGLIVNLIVGIIGGVLGGWLFGVLKINIGVGGILGNLITALIGAIVLLWIISLIPGKKKRR